MPPVKPMLARATDGIPEGDLAFEPKWDGFRCIVFRDGDEVVLGSRNERPLTRYFPEFDRAVEGCAPAPGGGRRRGHRARRTIGLGFDALQQRIHPGREPDQPVGGRDSRPSSMAFSTCWRWLTPT